MDRMFEAGRLETVSGWRVGRVWIGGGRLAVDLVADVQGVDGGFVAAWFRTLAKVPADVRIDAAAGVHGWRVEVPNVPAVWYGFAAARLRLVPADGHDPAYWWDAADDAERRRR